MLRGGLHLLAYQVQLGLHLLLVHLAQGSHLLVVGVLRLLQLLGVCSLGLLQLLGKVVLRLRLLAGEGLLHVTNLSCIMLSIGTFHIALGRQPHNLVGQYGNDNQSQNDYYEVYLHLFLVFSFSECKDNNNNVKCKII